MLEPPLYAPTSIGVSSSEVDDVYRQGGPRDVRLVVYLDVFGVLVEALELALLDELHPAWRRKAEHAHPVVVVRGERGGG